jgi:hypothetical protein
VKYQSIVAAAIGIAYYHHSMLTHQYTLIYVLGFKISSSNLATCRLLSLLISTICIFDGTDKELLIRLVLLDTISN